MNKYTYFDYTKDREVLFECEAEDILEADKKLFEATGKIASKESNIGCDFKAIPFDGPKMK